MTGTHGHARLQQWTGVSKWIGGALIAAQLAIVLALVPTPTSVGAQGVVDDVIFGVPHGFYESTQSVALTTATPGATIRYTLDGSLPSATDGSLYGAPLTIAGTTTLRAIAVRDGDTPSGVGTATYFFLDDVITQSSLAPPGFPTGPVNGQVFDYGMDPAVVTGNEAAVRDALTAIPSISVVTDVDNLFSPSTGIYTHPRESGRTWERPASVELIDPSGAEPGFVIDAGLRIRGGFSRRPQNPKHAFRLFFRGEYGGDLDYPLFGTEGANSFEKVDLRTAQNYAWSFPGQSNPSRSTFLREVFSRDLQADMGNPYTRSRYYHLYLNGEYWGLYMSQERVSKEYAESYFGGDKDDYDVIKHDRPTSYRYNATDGDDTAWRALWPIIVDQQITETEYQQLDGLVDFDSLIDTQLIYAYTAEIDGSPSTFLGGERGNNWYAVRNRTGAGAAGKWTFFVHDAEHSLGARAHDPTLDRTGPYTVDSAIYTIDYLHPYWIHRALTSHPDYAARVEARANELLRGVGPLTPGASQARWDEREATVNQVILAESARWGDFDAAPASTPADWATEVAWVETNWFPDRTSTVLDQLGLPPTVDNDPPTITNPGAQSSIVAAPASVPVGATDPEGDILSWSAIGLPPGLAIDDNTGVISGQTLSAGTFDVTVTVADPFGGSDIAVFTWTSGFPSPSRMILNEWNAVSSDEVLKNGGSDSFFGTVVGNGGDWFELIVTEDNLDVRGWTLELYDRDNAELRLELTDAFEFADDPLLGGLRAGTIITVSESVADDASFDPVTGDWWINLQSSSDDTGAFFTPDSQSNFDTNNDDWQLIIRDATGAPVFGPAGEGAGASGVGSTEIGELEADPSSAITPASLYDDGNDSTFGSANGFDGRFQDFTALRPPPDDTTEPEVTVVSPVKREILADSAVVVAGSATDDVGVASVGVAVRDRDSGLWLREDGSFGAIQYRDASLVSPGADTTDWTLALTLDEGNWAVRVRADDTSDNRSSVRPWVSFEVRLPNGDLTEPETIALSPAKNEAVTGPDVNLSGQATDDVAVDRVRVSVQDRVTKDWLQSDGGFAAQRRKFDATLTDPGTPTTDWFLDVSLLDGSYAMVAQAVDAAGNLDTSRAWVPFIVGTADNIEPESAIDSITQTAGANGPLITFMGTATDNAAVKRVAISVRDLTTGEWLQSDGSFDGFTLVTTTLESPGTSATGWSHTVDLAPGEYRLFVRAIDLAGNVESTRPKQSFTVTPGI